MRPYTVVYVNRGQIYKEEFRPDSGNAFSIARCDATGVSSEYFADPSREGELCNWYAVKKGPAGVMTKTYHATRQINELTGRAGGETLDGFDLAPDVALWLAVARYKETASDVELYFRIDDPDKLPAIAAHYGLEDPISDEQKEDLKQNPGNWRERNLRIGGDERVPIVVGSVAFENGKPVRLKAYKVCTVPK